MADAQSPDLTSALFEAAGRGDLAEVRRLAAEGADVNGRDSFGDPLLFNLLSALADDAVPDEPLLIILRTLEELGADLRKLDSSCTGILVGPIFGLKEALLAWLLSRGVDPNHGCGEPYETVLDLAQADYHYEAWSELDNGAKLATLPANCVSVEDEVEFYDREARAKDTLRPTILRLLRTHGALTGREMAARLGGNDRSRILWKDGAWHLNGEYAA